VLFLASFILKGPSQAALVAASMAILGLAVPPAAWVSAAAIVLVTLVSGPKNGLITTAFSLLGAGVFAYLIFSSPMVALVFVLLAWLPAWMVASVLRQTVSMAYSLQVLTAMALLTVVMVYTLAPNIGEHWREPLDSITLAELKQTEDWLIAFLPGLFVSSIMFGTLLSVLLARWWQATFYNPGGFGEEFRSLNLGKFSALCASTILLLAMLIGNVFSMALLAVVSVLYSVQALSLLHAVIKIRQVNGAWLFATYLMMFFIPQVLLLLILISVADPWLNIRRRISSEKIGS